MARFKFGKNKRKPQSHDQETSMTSSDHDHSHDLERSSVDSPQDIHPQHQQQQQQQQQQLHEDIPPPPPQKSPQSASPRYLKHHDLPSASSPWKRHKLFDSPFPRYRHAASAVSSDKNEIFLMGGLKEGSVFGDTWKISPQDQGATKFVAKNIEIANNNNPPARVGHSSVLCGNAYIIYGGDTVDTDFNGYPDNNFYLFNINNNKYTIPSHILNKPNGRYGHTIGVISLNSTSSRLYLFGGQLESEVFNDLYYFELNTFKSPKARWELIEPLNSFKPPPLANHSMSVYKNKIYIFGGIYNNEKVSNDLWCFDALINKWSQLPTSGSIPLPVNEHSSCIINDKLYIYGGNDFHGLIYDSLYVLNLHTLVWSKLVNSATSHSPGPRCGHSMTFLPNFNKIIIMGGDKNDYIADGSDSNLDTYELYNGEEVGTMLYALDLNLIDHFLDSTVSTTNVPASGVAGISPKKIAASASTNNNNIEALSKRPESPSNSMQDARRSSFQRHARSFSAGPEDFRTPTGSPDRGGFIDRGLDLNKSPHQQNPSSVIAAAAGAGAATGAISIITDKNSYNQDDDTNDSQVNKHQSQDEKFVDVDAPYSTDMSERDATSDLEELRNKHFLPPPSQDIAGSNQLTPGSATNSESSYHNGHASLLDNYNYIDSNENLRDLKDSNGKQNARKPSVDDTDTADEETGAEDKEATPQLEPQRQRRGLLGALNGANKSAEDAKVKKIIAELTTELTALKNSTKVQMQNATEKINGLESENQTLKQNDQSVQIANLQKQLGEKDALLDELKSAVDPKVLAINGETDDGDEGIPTEQNSKGITELTKYKLERLELTNKLIYLEQENASLNDKFAKFEPFMNNQVGELTKFQKIIKVQEEKIYKLSQQVRDEQTLHQQINDWKSKYENLSLEFDNFKTIHADEDITDDEEEITEHSINVVTDDAGNVISAPSNRSLSSTATGRKSKKDISSHLESLVTLWSSNQPSTAAESGETRSLENPQENPMVVKLQSQLNELLKTSKVQQQGAQSEVQALQNDLAAKLQALKTFEENYRDALQSVNNTSKALNKTNDELNSQKTLIEKLIKENNELKLFKKASRRISSRATPPSIAEENFSKSASPIAESANADKGFSDDEDDEVDGITSAHFNMKIKDLEADLFILKQERDQLKEQLTVLQKQLYLASTNQ